jgi:hypothetical protein
LEAAEAAYEAAYDYEDYGYDYDYDAPVPVTVLPAPREKPKPASLPAVVSASATVSFTRGEGGFGPSVARSEGGFGPTVARSKVEVFLPPPEDLMEESYYTYSVSPSQSTIHHHDSVT